MCRKIGKQPIIYFSRRTMGERGTQVARRGVNVSGKPFVATIYWANDEVVFHAYDTSDCKTLRTSLTMVTLKVALMLNPSLS